MVAAYTGFVRDVRWKIPTPILEMPGGMSATGMDTNIAAIKAIVHASEKH